MSSILAIKNVEEHGRFLNIADKDKIVAFMKDKHCTILEREGNGVRYLRVEDGDLVQLGKQIAELYHLQADGQMGMFIDGFEWKP